MYFSTRFCIVLSTLLNINTILIVIIIARCCTIHSAYYHSATFNRYCTLLLLSTLLTFLTQYQVLYYPICLLSYHNIYEVLSTLLTIITQYQVLYCTILSAYYLNTIPVAALYYPLCLGANHK